MKSKPSKLDAHAQRLDAWFGAEKQTLDWVQAQLKADGVIISTSRLSEWWAARQSQLLQDRQLSMIASGAQQCKAVDKEFSRHNAPEMETLIKLHRVLILGLSTQAGADPKIIKLVNEMMYPVLQYQSAVTKAKLEQQKLGIAERRVKLLEAKAAAFDRLQTLAKSAGGITPDTLKKIEAELKLL